MPTPAPVHRPRFICRPLVVLSPVQVVAGGTCHFLLNRLSSSIIRRPKIPTTAKIRAAIRLMSESMMQGTVYTTSPASSFNIQPRQFCQFGCTPKLGIRFGLFDLRNMHLLGIGTQPARHKGFREFGEGCHGSTSMPGPTCRRLDSISISCRMRASNRISHRTYFTPL